MKAISGLFVGCFVAAVVVRAVAAGNDASKPEADKRKVVEVKTAEEFVAAIASDRIIKLAPGEYVLTDVKERESACLRWDKEFDGKTLTIHGVKNLSVVGTGDKPVRLIVRPRYVFVLNFVKCEGVELSNLVMGHDPNRGECACGVLGASECSDVAVRKCDLFGCGTEGLTLTKVKKFRFEESVVRDCSYGILTATDCEGLAFTKSHFADNREFWGFRFEGGKDISFEDCKIEDNTVEEALFTLTAGAGIRIKGGTVSGNKAAALFDKPEAVIQQGTAFKDNRFEK